MIMRKSSSSKGLFSWARARVVSYSRDGVTMEVVVSTLAS